MAEIVGTLTKTAEPDDNRDFHVDFSDELGDGVEIAPPVEWYALEGERLFRAKRDEIRNGTVTLSVHDESGRRSHSASVAQDEKADVTMVVQGPTLVQTDDLDIDAGVDPEDDQRVRLDVGGGKAGMRYIVRVKVGKESSRNVYVKDVRVEVTD